eukprot:gene187-800_t
MGNTKQFSSTTPGGQENKKAHWKKENRKAMNLSSSSKVKEKQMAQENLSVNPNTIVSSPASSGASKDNEGARENVLRGQEHSFLMDKSDVEQMESGLLDLLDDFKRGKLHAFGGDAYLEKMNGVRNLQEKLAQMHFEIEEEDTAQRMKLSEDEQEAKSQQKQEKLMKNLENLCSSVYPLKTFLFSSDKVSELVEFKISFSLHTLLLDNQFRQNLQSPDGDV